MTPPGLLILDRDGVLNEMVVHQEHGFVDSPMNPAEVELKESSVDPLRRLSGAGYRLVIATNQPAAAKGKTTRSNLEAVHLRLLELLRERDILIDHSYICFHRAEDDCQCRKPRPGLLLQAMAETPGSKPENTWMIGDGITDVEAGKAAGLKTVFLAPKKSDIYAVLDREKVEPDHWCRNLAEFTELLLKGIG